MTTAGVNSSDALRGAAAAPFIACRGVENAALGVAAAASTRRDPGGGRRSVA